MGHGDAQWFWSVVLVGWWWSCDLFGVGLCLQSRDAASADPPGVGGGLWRGPQSPSPPEDRLTGAHVPLPKSRTAVARRAFSPWLEQPPSHPKTAEQADRRAVFMLLLLMLTPQKSAVAPR